MPNLGVCARAGRSWLLLRRPQKTTLHRPRVNNQSDPSPFPLEVCPTCSPPPDCNVKVYRLTLCLLASQARQPALPVECPRQPGSQRETQGVCWAGQLPGQQQGGALHTPCTELLVRLPLPVTPLPTHPPHTLMEYRINCCSSI